MKCPEIPYFQQDASDPFAPPRLLAPRVCELCGLGFVSRKALEDHAGREHGGVTEMRKRIFWLAQQMTALPLSIRRKRNMLANFDQELRCCRLGGTGDLEPRCDVACVVCARKGWLNLRYLVYLWKTLPTDKRTLQMVDNGDDNKDGDLEPNAKGDQDNDGDEIGDHHD